MTPFNAVIFDMDGVIVDSERLHERAFLDVFASLGFPGTTHGLDFTRYYGQSDHVVWSEFIRLHHPLTPLPDLLDLKRTRFVELLRVERPLFDGVIPLLTDLQQRYALGLASGSDHLIIDAVLNLENLQRFFQTVVSASDVGREKPDPAIFLHTAALLGAAPDRCCVVEDSVAGVQGARAAGMTAIAITHSFPAERLTQAGAQHVVRSLDLLRPLLLDHPN